MAYILGTFVNLIEFFGHTNIPPANLETACIPWNANPCIRPLNDTEKTQLIQTCGLVQSPLSNAQNLTVGIVNGQLANFRQSPWSAFLKLPELVYYFFKIKHFKFSGNYCTGVVVSTRHFLTSSTALLLLAQESCETS